MSEPVGEWTGMWRHEDFRLEEPIGKGGMAVVHRAVHLPSAGTYAIKIVSPRTAADLHHIDREIQLSVRVRSPHVMRTYGSEKVGTDVWIVMEHFLGHKLKSVLRNHLSARHRFPFFSFQRYVDHFRSIADGLQAIHRCGIVHCDVKPENVMLSEDGYRLLDLGIACEIHSPPGEVAGTPTYMAPEQIRNEPLDARTDLYSLGVTMLEAAVGVPPFVPPSLQKIADGLNQPGLDAAHRWDLLGKYLQVRIADLQTSRLGIDLQQAHTESLFEQHLKAKPRLPATFPYAPEVGKVLLKCLEKDPRLRWTNAGELIQRLEELCESHPSNQRW